MIPVINKIDLKNADPESVMFQMNKLFDIESKDVIKVSAKVGTGVEQLLNAIVERIPAPKGRPNDDLKAFVFDLWHEKFRGIILLVRIMDGCIKVGDSIRLSSSSSKTHCVRKMGVLYPDELSTDVLFTGQVGLIEANITDSNDVNVGDTLVAADYQQMSTTDSSTIVPKIQKPVQMVFASIYPSEKASYNDLAKAIDKLLLNDKGVHIIKETHPALGNGFR